MDLLDGLLQLAQLDARLDAHCNLAAAWTLAVPTAGRHEMPFHVLLQGQAIARVMGRSDVVLGTGDVLILVGGEAHRLEGTASAEGTLLCGRFLLPVPPARLLGSLLPPVLRVSSAGSAAQAPLATLLGLVHTESRAPGSGSAALLRHLCAALLALCLRATWSDDDVAPGLVALARHPRLAQLALGIVQQPALDWTLDDMAQHAHWSRSSLIRAFQSVAGLSPAAFLLRVRMAEASRQLLDGHGSVDAVGEAVGYASAAAFQRAFKREMGLTPAEWRLAPRVAEPVALPRRMGLAAA